MNITIKDVAKAANVSVATVSRVLNNKNNVSEDAVRAVNRAVEELGYSPSFPGRDLRKSETKRILALIGTAERILYNEIIHGMQDAAFKEGYDLLIAATQDDPDHELSLLSMLFSHSVDGVVLLSSSLSGKVISDLAKRYRIAVCLERLDINDVLCVTIDNERAGFDAASYLISKGRRRVGLITAAARSSSVIDRENGYKRALEEAGIPFDPNLVFRGELDADTGTRGCEYFMGLESRPDAIFSISDTIAVAAMDYAVKRGITVGKELLFFGFDNIAFSNTFIPRLSTVSQPCGMLGKTVIEKLIANMKAQNPDKSAYKLPHSLILRESTGDS